MSGEAVDVVDSPRDPSGAPIVFSTLADGAGIELTDRIERRRYTLQTPTRVDPEFVDADRLDLPVDAAVAITTSEVELATREAVYVRDDAGRPVTHTYNSVTSCPADRYVIDITASMKLYLVVESAVKVRPRTDSTTLEFGAPTRVTVGARSTHRRPNGTITTTADIDALRTTLSLLSSSIKTTRPERSYPTLRGHPPLVEIADEMAVPNHLDRPETGVTVEVNRSLDDLLVAAPLAFYLGAELTWGDRRIVTEGGFEHRLATRDDFQTAVERALKQAFFFDCLTRTEGLYPVDLHERQAFESRTSTPIDFEGLYDEPLGRRLETYLDVPFDTVADLIPTWFATTFVEASPSSVRSVPYLLDALSTIRTTGHRRITNLPEGDAPARTDLTPRSSGSVETERVRPTADATQHLVLPEVDSTMTSGWVGEGIPLGATNALASGFEHQLDREAVEGDIRVLVVCNDPKMRVERDSVREIYRSKGALPFDVTHETDVTTGAFRELIERETDFFHYIGHVDAKGFRCRDGWVDAGRLNSVGSDVFLLNGCTSYRQGEYLIERGSIAGIVSVTDVLNHQAAAIGRTIAQFVNYGFPLYAALEAARDGYSLGSAYALLGDGAVVLSQPTSTFPEYLELQSEASDEISVAHRTFLSRAARLGTELCPPYKASDRHYLYGGEIDTVVLSRRELAALLELPMPLLYRGDLRFSLDLSESD